MATTMQQLMAAWHAQQAPLLRNDYWNLEDCSALAVGDLTRRKRDQKYEYKSSLRQSHLVKKSFTEDEYRNISITELIERGLTPRNPATRDRAVYMWSRCQRGLPSYDKQLVPELKAHIKRRGLNKKGLKGDLIRTLELADENLIIKLFTFLAEIRIAIYTAYFNNFPTLPEQFDLPPLARIKRSPRRLYPSSTVAAASPLKPASTILVSPSSFITACPPPILSRHVSPASTSRSLCHCITARPRLSSSARDTL